MNRSDRSIVVARSLPRQRARRGLERREVQAAGGREDVFVRRDSVLQQAVSDDHVDSRAFCELPYLDFLNDAVMGDELQAQIRRLRASTTLAYRVPLDELDLRVEAFEHAQAQSHERIGFDGLTLAIEQQRIAFNLGELEFALVGSEDRFEQLVDDVRAVDELCRGQEFRVAADVRYQDRRTLGHRCPPNSLAVSPEARLSLSVLAIRRNSSW